MLTRSALTVLLWLLTQSAFADTVPDVIDESVKPVSAYTLTIDNQRVSLTEGESLRVDGAFTNPEVTLSRSAFRVFQYGGATFRYPAAFTFAADVADDEAKSWTLSGEDATLMWFDLAGELTATDMAAAMTEQFGRENCRPTSGNAPLTLDGKTYGGTSIHVRLGGQQLTIDLYRVSEIGGRTRLLVLQDVLNPAGQHSGENGRLCELLESSLRTTP